MTAFFKLLQTEIKLSLRDMNMVIFAVLMPLAVLVILGIIYGSQTIGDSSGFLILERSFGALCAISVCAGGLMGLPLVIADYREKKILKRFHVTPVRPVLLLAVELTVYVMYCAVSLVTLAIAAKCIWGVSLHGSAALFLGSWLLTTVSTLSIGLMVGGIAKNSKQAGVIACLLYFPMLIFSGTTLPLEVMPQRFRILAALCAGYCVCDGATIKFAPGDSIFIPADAGRIKLECEGKLYLMYPGTEK